MARPQEPWLTVVTSLVCASLTPAYGSPHLVSTTPVLVLSKPYSACIDFMFCAELVLALVFASCLGSKAPAGSRSIGRQATSLTGPGAAAAAAAAAARAGPVP